VTIRSKDGTPIDRPYFRWVQRQQVTFDVDAANAMERATGQKLPRTTVFAESFNAVPDRRGRYDILHNEALRTVLCRKAGPGVERAVTAGRCCTTLFA